MKHKRVKRIYSRNETHVDKLQRQAWEDEKCRNSDVETCSPDVNSGVASRQCLPDNVYRRKLMRIWLSVWLSITTFIRYDIINVSRDDL